MRIAANISTLFRELPLLERFEAARAGGFDGVEIQYPYAVPADALAKAAAAARMPVVLINAPIIPSEHPYGIAGRPELKDLFRAQLAQARDYAEALDAPFVHVLAGRAHGRADREQCLRVYEQNLLLAAETLRPSRVGVLIEPLNPYDAPGYLLDSFDLARSMLAREERIGMQFDAYHATRMGLDVVAELEYCRPYVRHVQFADAPGRREPGTGTVPFGRLLAALRDARYPGWLGAEYSPSQTTARTLGWIAEWRNLMRADLRER